MRSLTGKCESRPRNLPRAVALLHLAIHLRLFGLDGGRGLGGEIFIAGLGVLLILHGERARRKRTQHHSAVDLPKDNSHTHIHRYIYIYTYVCVCIYILHIQIDSSEDPVSSNVMLFFTEGPWRLLPALGS